MYPSILRNIMLCFEMHTYHSDGAFNRQNGHVNDMQLLTDELLTLSRSDDLCQNELALTAWQLVPGLYTRLQKKKHPRLHEKLREWTQHESLHLKSSRQPRRSFSTSQYKLKVHQVISSPMIEQQNLSRQAEWAL